MEDHIVPFVKKWKVGPGMMGEHGGESIHHLFNELKQRYANMPNAATRCYHTLKRHLIETNPSLPSAPEPAQKRKKN